ncbi:protein EPIDERMAL PATTERNING FACTOR 2-like [Typha latifolia]|uniref:protein EPIDERMAL PATTERNING FACTOR 2-like n=1 Tax=Typha latifolia TaxID=4733 RepID=UPI003C30BD2D
MEYCSHGRSQSSFLVAILLLLLSAMSEGLRLTPNDVVGWNGHMKSEIWRYGGGSRYPDCSHACRACIPCKRVMVNFKCSEEAESCPIVYRCMCKGRYYHVPSI